MFGGRWGFVQTPGGMIGAKATGVKVFGMRFVRLAAPQSDGTSRLLMIPAADVRAFHPATEAIVRESLPRPVPVPTPGGPSLRLVGTDD